MPRPKTTFRSYSSAATFAKNLKLRTMRDWVAFSKNGDTDGHARPSDIPSNPWIVYQAELKSMGKKFSINEFLGSKRSRISKSALVKPDTTASQGRPLTYSQAKVLLRKMRVKTRADFNALLRMRLLPEKMPEQPASAFRAKWSSWRAFLS